ncbi:hypothetical protein BRDID11002_54110 [Bradyrhizobium diazoefficiens]
MFDPLIVCGQQSLAVFCVGVFLSFVGHFELSMSSGSLFAQLFVSIAGIAIMTTVAYYISWSKRQGQAAEAPAVQAGARNEGRLSRDARSSGRTVPTPLSVVRDWIDLRQPGPAPAELVSPRLAPPHRRRRFLPDKAKHMPSHFHAIVWIDHTQARIFHLGLSGSDEITLHPHLATRSISITRPMRSAAAMPRLTRRSTLR